ncbi:MAG: hypothetical protein AAF390_10180 [Pseudomonadota bacterium]
MGDQIALATGTEPTTGWEASSDVKPGERAFEAEPKTANNPVDAPEADTDESDAIEDAPETRLRGDNSVMHAGIGGFLRGLFGRNAVPPANAIQSTTGLVRPDPNSGALYTPGDTAPKSDELDAGYYAMAGVLDEGGTVRQYFTKPSIIQGDVIDKAPVGKEVKQGDVLYRIENHDIEADFKTAENQYETAKDSLASTITAARGDALEQKADVMQDIVDIDVQIAELQQQIGDVDTDIRNAASQITSFDKQIAKKKEQIVAAKNNFEIDQEISGTSAFDRAKEGGALSRNEAAEERSDTNDDSIQVSGLEEELAALEAARTEAVNGLANSQGDKAILDNLTGLIEIRDVHVERLDTIVGLETLTAEEAIENVRNDDTATMDASVIREANAALNLEDVYATRKKEFEDLTVRAPIDGVVAQQLPDGLVFNTLDGSVALNNSQDASLGQVSDDPEEISVPEGNDGGVPTVVAADDAQATIVFNGLTPDQASEFKPGETVKFRTQDGREGFAQVLDNISVGRGPGHRVRLENPRFLDGTPLTASERVPLQVWDSATPTTSRVKESSDTVAFGEVEAPSVDPDELPQVEQDFNVSVPIFAEDDSSKVLGYLEVTGRTVTDGRKVEVLPGTTAVLKAEDGSKLSAPIPVDDEAITLTSSGSNSGGPSRRESGVEINLAVAFVGDKDSEATTNTVGGSRTGNNQRTISGEIPGLPDLSISFGSSTTVSGSRSGTDTRNPRTQQFQVPISIVPSGDMPQDAAANPETVRIHAPSAIVGRPLEN